MESKKIVNGYERKEFLEHCATTFATDVVCGKCGNFLPPHTWEEHYQLGDTFLPEWYTCPHVELTAEEIMRN
mgnify:CR=1 FL=1|jgi:hypothetical protein